MGTTEKVGILILLLLLLLMFAFLAKKTELPTSNVETGQGGWSVPKPPPVGPGGAWDADVMYNQYKPVLGALLFEAALEAAGELENKLDNGKQEVEQKIEAQNEIDSKINSEIDTDIKTQIETAVEAAFNQAFQMQMNLISDAKVLSESQLQTAIQSAVNSAVETAFETALAFGDVRALTENQLQTAVQTAVNSAVESAFESSLNFGDVRAMAENQLQTAVQTAVNSAVESAFESSLAFGDVRALAENQLQTAIQTAVNSAVESAFESSLNFGDVRALAENQLQTAVQSAVNSAVESAFESSLKFGDVRALAESQLQTAVQSAVNSAVESAFESSLKFGDVRALAENQLQTAVQTAVNSAVESAFESALKFGDVRALAESQLQTAIQAAVNSAVESAFESSLKFGDVRALAENQLQTAVQSAINSAVESAFESSLKFGDTRALTESQLQTAIQTAVNSAVESAFESSLKFGDVRALAENQLQTAVQTAVNSAVESAFESSLKFGDTRALTENLRANLESIKTQLEQKLQKYMENRARGNPKMKYQLNASCAIARMVMGTPEIDEQGKVDYSAALKGLAALGYDGSAAASFGHRPKKYLQLRVPKVWTDLVLKVNKIRAQVKKNAVLPGSKAIDTAMESSIGKPIFNVIDKIDTISDRLEIVTLFSDALFYDPDYSALSWDPLLPATFKSIGQKMINEQLKYIETYNDIEVPNDRYPFDTAQYPLIAGPLDLLDVVAGTPPSPAYQESRGDPEYNRYRIQTMLDVVRESLLRDPSTVHHRALLNSTAFNGIEADMQVTISDPTDKLVFYIDDNMTCQDADNLYADAYTRICTYNGGVVYEDTYNYNDPNSTCPTYKRRRFQCGFATKAECRNAGDIWMNSYGQAGNYGEWMNMKTIKDTRVTPYKDVINEASTILQTNRGFACVITGSGLRSVCNESGGTYGFNTKDEPVCTFTPAVCQWFGTCSATASDGTTYCELPPSLQGAQMFFGQQLPREWVKIHGCNFGRNIHDIGSFASVLTSFGKGGKTFFQDMLANKANHKKGLENVFLGPDALNTWLSLSTIIGPALLTMAGVGSGPIMVVIFVIVGSMMADQAIKENRKVAQTNVNEPAEYTVGGWATTSTTVSSDVFTIESATMTSATIQQNHNFIIGDSVSLIGLRWTNGTTPEIRLPEIKVTVLTVPTTKSFTFSTLPVTLTGFQKFVDSKGYTRKTDAAADPVTYATSNSRPGRKVLKGVGYTDGWVTKPLMPKDASGTTLPTSAAITSVAGVVEKSFYVDVDQNGKAYPDGGSCYGQSSSVDDVLPTISVPATSPHKAFADEYNAFVTNYKNFRISDWLDNYTSLARDAQAEFDAKFAEAQARFDSLSSQRDEIKNACTGINFFTKCGPALVKAARGSLDSALDSLENLINEAAEDLKKYAEMAVEVVKQFFEKLGNYIKKMFEDAEKLMKYSATLAVSDLTGRCVDSRINMNYKIGKFIGDLSNGQLSTTILKSTFGRIPNANFVPGTDPISKAIDKMIDGIEFFGQKILKGGVKCVVTGKINTDLDAFTDECYKIVAVDSATGTIASPGKGLKAHTDDWMDKSEYKRLCSNLPTPMIHAWAAPLGNKLWCLPPQPPSSWANPNIGTLTPIETAFRVNRSWTNFADGVNEFFEDYPTFPRKVMEQTPSESLPRTGTAQNWYYQLVYSKDDFNLDNLWNDTLLSQHFSLSTISQMRIEYCTDFFFGNDERNIPEDLTGEKVNPKCWGYLSFAMTGYGFMPMTILSKTNSALTSSSTPAYYTPASGFNN